MGVMTDIDEITQAIQQMRQLAERLQYRKKNVNREQEANYRKSAQQWARSMACIKFINKFNEKWRTERDSNPRYAFTYTRVPGVRLKPLGHLSLP